MKIEIPSEELEALHRKQNGDVLPITVHIQTNPTRLGFLGANGEILTFVAGQTYKLVKAPEGSPAEQVDPGAVVPPPQRVSIEGFEANLFGALGRPA